MLGMLPLGTITLLCLAVTTIHRRWLCVGLKSLAFISVLAFAIDAFVIMEINDRLTGSNIIKYLPEWRMVLHFAKPAHFLLIGAVLVGGQ